MMCMFGSISSIITPPPPPSSEYAYTMAGNIFGDMESVGVYNGIASYLNTGTKDIKTSFNSLYMATPNSNTRVNRVADGGSMIGAPIGPFDACIADVNTTSGDCLGERVFKPSEYKFSVFGYAAGAQYDAAVKAGQNGFPAGMDKVGVRMKLFVVGLTELQVNRQDYDPSKQNQDVTRLDFQGEKGGISIAFPTKYNIGTMEGLWVPMSAQKTVKIKLHGVNPETGMMFLDYLFDVETIKAGTVFVYDPTVAETCKTDFMVDPTNASACVADLCNTAAKAACATANKVTCTSGSATCGACVTGYTADGATCKKYLAPSSSDDHDGQNHSPSAVTSSASTMSQTSVVTAAAVLAAYMMH
jgi:hypothetical protein